jgi:2-methylcitrate dehydratase PrpD
VREDPLAELISWAGSLRCEELPAPVRAASKAYLVNTLAAMFGGSAAPGAVEAVRQVRHWSGRAESSVAIHGFKAPAPLAAFANGVMAHALDYDDTQVGTGFHPNVSLVPALLAAAEAAGHASRTVNGSAFLAAYVAGLEIGCRMTLAATNRARHPWLTTTLFGVFGATVGAGLAQGLDEAQLRHALGIAYSSAGGNRQGLLDGAMIQRVQPGLSAQAAVAAAAFAAQGVTGAHDVLEGRYGLYPSHYGTDYDPRQLLDGLGHEFRMLDLALKPYPCCSYSQEPIEAASELAGEPGFDAGEVREIVVSVASAHAAGLVDHVYAPRSCAQVDAQFSMQYVIGATAVRGGLGLKDFQEAALRDPAVIDYARRVRVEVDPQKEGSVEFRMRDGSTRARRVTTARGHPSRPFGERELLGKLAECAALAATPLPAPRARVLYDMVMGLEKLEDATLVVREAR